MIQKNTLDRKNHSQTGALPHYVNPSVLSVHKRVRYLFLSFPFFPLTFFIYIYTWSIGLGTVPIRLPFRVYRPDLARPPDCRNQAGLEPCLPSNPSLRRGTKEINEGVVCAWHCYIRTYIQVPVNNDAPSLGVWRRRGEENHERGVGECRKSRIRRGWRDDDVPGNGKIIEFSKRNGEVCVRRAVDRRISFDKSRHLLPRAPSSLCPLFSFLLFLYFFE